MEEPSAKKQKTEEKVEEDGGEKPAPVEDAPQELEGDAEKDAAKRIKEDVVFLTQDTTLNVLPSDFGTTLTCVTDGGFQHLLAGARASVGAKAGRYMFETKVLQNIVLEDNSGHSRQQRKHFLRIGFSTASSQPFLGETEDSICFDSDGSYIHCKRRCFCAAAFGENKVVAVLLNLDENSANANTISLFVGGVRVSKPQPLPDALKGKALYPTVTYRNISVHVNFGPSAMEPLPFTCRMFQDATAKDCVVTTYPAPKDGKYEVLLPVCFPDEGGFDALDMFLEKNPGYIELSDRAMRAWSETSGITLINDPATASNDRPGGDADELNLRTVLRTITSIQQRNYVVMEVRANWLQEGRKLALAAFRSPMFKTVAQVMIGEPPLDLKKIARTQMLNERQAASDAEFRVKKAEEKKRKDLEKVEENKRKELEKRQKQLERRKRQMEKERKKQHDKLEMERKKQQEEVMKKLEEDVKAKEDETSDEKKDAPAKEGDSIDEKKDAPAKEGDTNDEKKDALDEQKEAPDEKQGAMDVEEPDSEPEKEDPEEVEEVEAEEEDPPQVELTAEEQKVWFRKTAIPDLTSSALSSAFAKFTIPDKSEGFSEIRFEWIQSASKCEEFLKQWILLRKQTTRIEDITPSAWFRGKQTDWQKVLASWKIAQTEYSTAYALKEATKAAKEREKATAAANAAVEKVAEAGQIEDMAENNDKPKEEEKEEVEEKLDFESLDVFGVDNVLDAGLKTPLCKDFLLEDWLMLSLRYELHLLAHAFQRDANDPERSGIHMDHLAFYYQKYYKKDLSLRFYGADSFEHLLSLVDDTVYLGKAKVLHSQLPDDMESVDVFCMLVEEARRYRTLRIQLGEESAKLKLQLTMQGPQPGSKGGPKGYFASPGLAAGKDAGGKAAWPAQWIPEWNKGDDGKSGMKGQWSDGYDGKNGMKGMMHNNYGKNGMKGYGPYDVMKGMKGKDGFKGMKGPPKGDGKGYYQAWQSPQGYGK